MHVHQVAVMSGFEIGKAVVVLEVDVVLTRRRTRGNSDWTREFEGDSWVILFLKIFNLTKFLNKRKENSKRVGFLLGENVDCLG